MASNSRYNGPGYVKSHDKSDFNTRLSMKLSGILRHGKDGFKKHIDPNGWLDISTLLRNSHFCQNHQVTYEQISDIVKSNAKQRFKISDDGKRIKANQGHTLEILDTSLHKISLEDAASYSAVVHGTYHKVQNLILKHGLSRMKRNHIHLTASDRVDSSIGVISGFRGSCELLVYIDMCKAIKDGHEFYLSENNVILCPGNEDGYLESKYFLKIYDRVTGKVIDDKNEKKLDDSESQMVNEQHFNLKKEVGKLRKKLNEISKIENIKDGKLEKEQQEKILQKEELQKQLDTCVAKLKEIANSQKEQKDEADQELPLKEDPHKEGENETCQKLLKQVGKLRKKVNEIEELEEEQKNGKELHENQLEKIKKKEGIKREIEKHMTELREMGVSADTTNTPLKSETCDQLNQSNESDISDEQKKERMIYIQKEIRRLTKKLKDIKSLSEDLVNGKKVENDLDKDQKEKLSKKDEFEKNLDELTSELESLS